LDLSHKAAFVLLQHPHRRLLQINRLSHNYY
jgi:hypothetical protein